VHGGLSVIGFDVVPIVAAETMASGMAETFCDYLSLVKHAERVSAISEASATAFRAFCEMVAAEGIPVPEVRAQPLPTEVRSVSRSEIAAARAALRLTGEPVVLVVGSHEPRKNHLAILEAAERLWASGLRFELLMVGGNEWRSDEFRRFVDRLRDEGRPINLRPRVTDTELWSAYRLARFTVFPSLLEGFGLPVAESIAAGTPVITSSHGSMAEIAAGGGALLVDPRDTDAITAQMRLLLTDDEIVERLRNEARARNLGSWDDYAREVWEFFTADASAP
jgi:glycosyltransferase involved in cell wall biosynthesis